MQYYQPTPQRIYRPVQQRENGNGQRLANNMMKNQHVVQNGYEFRGEVPVPYSRVQNSPNFQRKMRDPNIWIKSGRPKTPQPVDVPYHMLNMNEILLQEHAEEVNRRLAVAEMMCNEAYYENQEMDAYGMYPPLVWNRLNTRASDIFGSWGRPNIVI